MNFIDILKILVFVDLKNKKLKVNQRDFFKRIVIGDLILLKDCVICLIRYFKMKVNIRKGKMQVYVIDQKNIVKQCFFDCRYVQNQVIVK